MPNPRALLMLAFLAAAGLGCPRDVEVPEPTSGGDPCAEMADCNVQDCGLLRACVDGFCEAEPTLAIPCLDAR